ncbi:HFR105Wp [Eremothecium sinecaudum]|uniref:HFR105Wp n=1 Tax=Eremothecium sinecaudum TaxID=45286 RepID=A0A120K2M0_9SACH|nr:HFR105Wp [Eremothecium sinecaudum]AMD21960.1 HFR105Wp [Eremothecium sinecaudum]
MIQVNNYINLLYYMGILLSVLGAIELFKYSTRLNYEYFHCTTISEPVAEATSMNMIYAVGSSSCDKRGEIKTILRKITRDYDPNLQPASFCLVENRAVGSIHYPDKGKKGPAGYVAYAAYDDDEELLLEQCAQDGATVFHL